MDALEVLTGARALVAKGWLKGNWFALGQGGQVVKACSAGAIRVVANNGSTEFATRMAMQCGCGCGGGAMAFTTITTITAEAEDALARGIRETMPSVSSYITRADIPEWNDSGSRTLEEVLAAFDKAIANLTPEPPPRTYVAAACVATAVEFGQSKVTYTLGPVYAPTSWVPDTIPETFIEKVLVST